MPIAECGIRIFNSGGKGDEEYVLKKKKIGVLMGGLSRKEKFL